MLTAEESKARPVQGIVAMPSLFGKWRFLFCVKRRRIYGFRRHRVLAVAGCGFCPGALRLLHPGRQVRFAGVASLASAIPGRSDNRC
jgi:hypothetical protein